MVLGLTEDDIIATEEMIQSAEEISFTINENKTKYMCVAKEQQVHQIMKK